MFKYYKKQFLYLLRNELNGVEALKTDSGKAIEKALIDSEIQKKELAELMIKINSERTNDIINQSKEEVSKVLMASLSSGIKIDNKDTDYSLRLINFIKGSSKYGLNNNAIDTIKKNKDKSLLITGYNGTLTVTPMSDPNIESDDDDEQEIVKNKTETQTENKDFTEANNWYKNSSKKPSYTDGDKEALNKRFGIEKIEQGVNEDQFNKIVKFQEENSLKGDGKIGKVTLEKIKVDEVKVKQNIEESRKNLVTPEIAEKENSALNILLDELIKKQTLNINDFNNIKNDKGFLSYIRFNEVKLKISDNDKEDIIRYKQKILKSYNNTEINNKLLTVYKTLNNNIKTRADGVFIELENFLKRKNLIESKNDEHKIIINTNPQQTQGNEAYVESGSGSYDLYVSSENKILEEEQEKIYDNIKSELSHTKLRAIDIFPKIKSEGFESLTQFERKWIDDFDLDEGIGFNGIEIDPKTNNILFSFDDNLLNEGHNKEISISGCIENNKFDKIKFLEQVKNKVRSSIINYKSKLNKDLNEKELPTVKEISDEEKERLKESIKRELSYTKISDKTSYFDKNDRKIKNFDIGQIVGLEDIEVNLDENKIKFSLDDDLINGKPSKDLVINMNLVDKNGNFDKMDFFVELAKLISN